MEYMSLHGYIRNTPSDTELHAEHQLRADRSTWQVQFSSVQSQLCPTLQSHELQQARPPCLSPTPRIHPNPCPLSRWCHPTILSSVIPFSFCPQSFPASGQLNKTEVGPSNAWHPELQSRTPAKMPWTYRVESQSEGPPLCAWCTEQQRRTPGKGAL